MSLIAEQYGHGPSLVFLHGWGLNSGVWQRLATRLAKAYRVTLIDLPGFGVNHDRFPPHYDLDELTDMVAGVCPDDAAIVGWSLGGLVAQKLALSYPQRAGRLICVASSPRFVAEADWPGIAPNVLEAFASQLHSDIDATIARFLAIQAMGSRGAKSDIQAIKLLMGERPAPAAQALSGGLRLLQRTDLRQSVANIACPTLRLYGRNDSLVPVAVMEKVERLQPSSISMLFPGASHAPFISHEEEFARALTDYLQR
ncbi:pimeloyl-ACP methyl ester esterase BioH [Lacimicrobium sp. SS2-24]|uniref:pimeloyl-ACP methyl ester esterase BioH n=1 Tax=Lacimicrobium sp. SS2-24 TaxID=2005569 RepID=UPI000B4C03BA|nr:pimeloyl-ACP methyl ester esterase BioH [Lacimicrobium sp. SS2-24]